jgi:HTH-type transcriptional regulator / antitoxin HigA
MNDLWKTLKSDEEYNSALKRTIEIFHAEQGTPESDELELLLSIVMDYENRHFHIPSPD